MPPVCCARFTGPIQVLSTAFGLVVPEDGPQVAGACVKSPPALSGGSYKAAVTVSLLRRDFDRLPRVVLTSTHAPCDMLYLVPMPIGCGSVLAIRRHCPAHPL